MNDGNEWIGIAGVVLGVLLGFLGQLILARRQEARRLDDARREVYAQFLTAVKFSLDHLAEGGMNRLNGAVERGAYSGTYFEDHQKLQVAISGMRLVSTRTVLGKAEEVGEAHWEFASTEENAERVDRSTLDDATFARLGQQLLDSLKRLSGMNEAFIAAAQRELRLSALLGNKRSEDDKTSASPDADRA